MIAVIFILLGSLLRTLHIDILKTEMSGYNELIYNEFKVRSIKPLPSTELSQMISDFSAIMKLRITIINPEGKVIADSDVIDVSLLENHQYRREVIEAQNSGSGFSMRYSTTLKTDMLYHALLKDNLIIRLAKPLHEVDKSLSFLKNLVFNVSFFALITSVFIVVVISFKITKPLKDTLLFASDFANGNYKKRILNYSNDEIGDLQKALNKMADKIVETINDHIFEHKKLEATLDNISDGIAMVDSRKHIVIHNNSFLTMLGITADLKDKQYFEIIRNSTLNARIENNLKGGDRDTFEIEMPNDRFYEAVINPIKEEKIIQGILVVLRDISEKRKIERIKSDLVSNVSHELKTPIAIVRGYLETIKENYDNRILSMNYIDRAISNVDRQNALIQDIIKLSMIESSKEFEREKIDLRIIIEGCLNLLAPKISDREIILKNNLGNSIDYTIYGNLFLVEEIFFNIIDNGINYNSHGGTLSITGSDSANEFVIKISDTGVGIPSEYKDRIFERFYRVDRSRSRATGGTGLGLSIVKHAAMVLLWDISVDSDNKGSTFTITIGKTVTENSKSV
jgi:two-component system phosphate regulon sensor histidine kinase PhoR